MTESTRLLSIQRTDLIDTGYVLRHIYPVDDRCPMCAGRLTREEWGQAYHATIGLDVCCCGFTSQRHTIA